MQYVICRAVLAFSTEATASGSSYNLAPTGRYSHSKQYLQDVLCENGWNSIVLHESVIRHNAGKPVQGYLCVAVRI
jgi:predicted TPR repeat methyltransferase